MLEATGDVRVVGGARRRRRDGQDHVSNVLMKLGLRDRVQAVALAYETELMTPGG